MRALFSVAVGVVVVVPVVAVVSVVVGVVVPVSVVVPARGFSLADAEGGDLWDPAADRAFIDSLRDALRDDFAYEEVDAHVDDADFADLVAERYLALTGGRV